MNKERQFLEMIPNGIFLSIHNTDIINNYLSKKGLLSDGETLLKLKKAGDGNMNCVLRAITNKRTFILKQSRPWVEKYPQIEAPIDRILVEAEYMQAMQKYVALKKFSPAIIHFDSENYLLLMEDLGETTDLSYIYEIDINIEISELSKILDYLNDLHTLSPLVYPSNIKMKLLNQEHIFRLPFQNENGLNLNDVQNGLDELSKQIKLNKKLSKKVNDLAGLYMEKGKTLIHGDFYPGSILKTDDGLKVIDAEFSFLGFPEFDWSVMLAHMYMSEQDDKVVQHIDNRISENYNLDKQLIYSLAGVEILRRFFGVAQLPLTMSIDRKATLTSKAIEWILN